MFKKNKQRFCKEFGIESIGIFGSFSRGSQEETSDLDILIEMEQSKKNIHHLMGLRKLRNLKVAATK
ncbi:MAG: nucleotidyltransferase family protein [Candidatus Scalindua sp.]